MTNAKIATLLKSPRKTIAVLVSWTAIQLGLWAFGGGSAAYVYFWPFQSSDLLYYDRAEFFVYGVLPWVVYAVYRLLNE